MNRNNFGSLVLVLALGGCASLEERRAGWLDESRAVCAKYECAPPNQEICLAYREICKQDYVRREEEKLTQHQQMTALLLLGVSQGINQQAALYGQQAQWRSDSTEWHHERALEANFRQELLEVLRK